MTLTCAWWTDKECVLATFDESASCQIKDQASIHLLVEVEIKIVECLLRITETCLLSPSLQQPIASSAQLVRDQARDQIDWRHRFGLRLAQPRLQYCRHTAQSQLS